MGISMPQPNKCEMEQFLCDIKLKRKQIKLCREFNQDMRLLGNSILHHGKSIADAREAERLLGLAIKIRKTNQIYPCHVFKVIYPAILYTLCVLIVWNMLCVMLYSSCISIIA